MTAAANPTAPTLTQRNLRIGALVAPLVAPFAAAPLAVLIDPNIYASFLHAVFLFPFVAFVALIVAYLGMAVLGLPTILLLRKTGHLSALMLCALSVPLGASFLLVSRLTAIEPFLAHESLRASVFGAGVALAVAVAFCIATGLMAWPRKQSSK